MELTPIGFIQRSAPINDDEDKRRKKERFLIQSKKKKSKTLEGKTLELVMQRFANQKYFGKLKKTSLYATAEAPKIVQGLISEFLFKTKPKSRKIEIELKKGYMVEDPFPPVGIRRCAYNSWISSLMQFILHIPSISEMFLYTSHSLVPFLDFIETYKKEQGARNRILSITTQKLLEGLRRKFPHRHFKNAHLMEVLTLIMESVSNTHFVASSDLLAHHPENRFFFDKEIKSLESEVEKSFLGSKLAFPKELLVGLQKSEHLQTTAKEQLPFYRGKVRYDLRAFVEYRSEDRFSGTYITYLKVGHVWYQCDNLRIIQLRSVNLPIALSKAVLFYYTSH